MAHLVEYTSYAGITRIRSRDRRPYCASHLSQEWLPAPLCLFHLRYGPLHC